MVATTVSSGIFSVKTTEVKASISTQTALKNLNKAKAEMEYSNAEAKKTNNAVLRGKKSVRFVTINKKGKLVKNSRKAKPGVKYHVNRVFKMGKRSYAQIKLGRKYVMLNTKYVKFI